MRLGFSFHSGEVRGRWEDSALAVLNLSCSTQNLHCIMWDLSLWHMDSSCSMQGVGTWVVVTACGLSSPWHVGS